MVGVLWIDNELHTKLKIKAAKRNQTLRSYVEEILEKGCK